MKVETQEHYDEWFKNKSSEWLAKGNRFNKIAGEIEEEVSPMWQGYMLTKVLKEYWSSY